MIFVETKLKGAFLIEPELRSDERGFFARRFCQHEFANHGLPTQIAQCNISFNLLKGTIRGMHFQRMPKAESKAVTCTRGRIYDVIVDLRPDSPSYCQWEALELSEDNRKIRFIPGGFAHGFQTLTDNAEVHYQMFEFYCPDHAEGVRWNDPVFAIQWPSPPSVISARDSSYPDFRGQMP